MAIVKGIVLEPDKMHNRPSEKFLSDDRKLISDIEDENWIKPDITNFLERRQVANLGIFVLLFFPYHMYNFLACVDIDYDIQGV